MTMYIGNAEVEDVVYNGSAVEEVWLNGVRVFDAYDPSAVPNGTLSFSSVSGNFPSSYAQATSGTYTKTSTGQAGATGYITLSADSCSGIKYALSHGGEEIWTASTLVDSNGNPTPSQMTSFSINEQIALCYADGSELLWIAARTYPDQSNRGDEMYAACNGYHYILNSSANSHMTKNARIDWNFKTQKVTISGNNNFTTVTKDFTNKWRAGMYIKYTAYAYASSGPYHYVVHSGEYKAAYDVWAANYVLASAGN